MFAGLSNVSCKGDETSIKDCSLGESSKNVTCPRNSTVTIHCAGKSGNSFSGLYLSWLIQSADEL